MEDRLNKLRARVAEKVVVDEDGCHIWTGSLNERGLARMYVAPGLTPYLRAGDNPVHRIAYWLHYGFVPAGRIVISTCGKNACCKPQHLRAATRSQVATAALRERRLRKGVI